MIYVHFDPTAIPKKFLDDLKAAADTLNGIVDPEARKEFIKDNAPKWAAVRKVLSKMSNKKCWYSEAKDCVSRYQIDHFRPHGRAKQAEGEYSDGYSWLAFDVENFRLAGVLCNTCNRSWGKPCLSPIALHTTELAGIDKAEAASDWKRSRRLSATTGATNAQS